MLNVCKTFILYFTFKICFMPTGNIKLDQSRFSAVCFEKTGGKKRDWVPTICNTTGGLLDVIRQADIMH